VAQGVVESLFQTLHDNMSEDPIVVKESVTALAILVFGTYWERGLQVSNLEALFMISRARIDFFYPFLSILIEMIISPEVPIEQLENVMVVHKCLAPLVRALSMSGWLFHRKEAVYKCFPKLAASEKFLQCLRDVQGGISVLALELKLRKATVRQGQREGDDEGDGTPKLLALMRRDMAAIKIQAQARRKFSVKRIRFILEERTQMDSMFRTSKPAAPSAPEKKARAK
jgi:hypothetical protein